VLLAVALLAPTALAQTTTGRVGGQVSERGTGETLVGVNVFIEGTQIGAVTDASGAYMVLRVPPGRHTVVFSYVGYTTVRVENVEVTADRTARINVEMQEEALAGGEVVVTAVRPPVVHDRTSTTADFGLEEIRAAPVEGLRGLLDLNAGVARTGDGNISVRGGGAYEVQFLVNGVEQVMSSSSVPGYGAIEKANNSWKFDLNPIGVQSMEVVSGGFSAEFGNAQSGVVRVQTREGGRRLEGEYRTEYRAPGQYHWGPYLYGPETFEWQRLGAFENWLERFGDNYTEEELRSLHARWLANHSPSFTPQDTVFTRDGRVLWLPGQEVPNKTGVYDYTRLPYTRHLFGIGGPLGRDTERLRFFLSGEVRDKPTRVPTVERVQRYRNLTLTTSLQAAARHRLRLTNTYQYYLGGIASGADDIRWAGRDARWKYTLTADSPREEATISTTLNYTFGIDDQSYLEATLAHSYEQYRVQITPLPPRGGAAGDPWFVPDGPWFQGYDFRQVFSFTSLYQQDARTHFLNGTVDYTRQITPTWNLRAGLQARRWDLFYSAVSGFRVNVFVADTGFGEYYEATPTYAGAYVQNRLEFQGMVANLGLRLDGYNFNSDVPADRFNIFYPGTGATSVGDPTTRRSPTHTQLSPRVGLSFPVGERTAFRLHYGHFASMPQFRQALLRSTWAGWNTYGNGDLGPERTIQYEVGLQQALDDRHRLDLVGYYNDRVRQVSVIRLVTPTSSTTRADKATTSYESNGYGSSFGVEMAVERFAAGRWHYRLSYTLSRTTSGVYGPVLLYSDDPDDPRNFLQRYSAVEGPGAGDRPHRVRGFLTYRLGAGEGVSVFGFRPFEDTQVSLIYSAQSGPTYTYRLQGDPLDLQANRRYPIEENVNVSVTRAVSFGGADLTLGLRVDNALNHRILTPIDLRAGLDDWVERAVPRDRWDPYDPHRTYLNVPRQVFFNVGVRF
jgi:outer membrane receptor protein involved in Fe transport